MDSNQKLADLIFPNVSMTLDDLETKYPERKLPSGAMVTRFAPSPTGFLHTGSLFASLVSWRFAKQSGGVFFCRLEDTDQKREISGSADKVLTELLTFGIIPDESFLKGGAYGPYVQSERKWIYDIVVKYLISRGLAYPCFCSHEELDAIRREQEAKKLNSGYYGEYAKCRFLTPEQAYERIENGENYVIRFRSPGNGETRISFDDAIRGHIEFPENIQDIVIMKGDGLPTYHFAHLVDDHFMHTTHVTRGEEWMSSVPIHLQLFDTIGWKRPVYAHLPVIMKMDGDTRRKLSKRKDEEASVSYFLEKGYPVEGFLEYLMTIANTNFEEWRIENPSADIFSFRLDFSKMTLDGALFDLEKINHIAKERLGAMSASEIAEKADEWAETYDLDLHRRIISDFAYFESILSIERGGDKPRKDYTKYSDIFPVIGFMYDDIYYASIKEGLTIIDRFPADLVKKSLEEFLANPGLELSEEDWFDNLKATASKCNFAEKSKDYKKNPEQYVGHVGDYAEIIRVAVSGRKNTPNFYHILRILGLDKIRERIYHTISLLPD